ncbi:PGY2 [Symbiodinium microadriaticum]|nr:PGY2 [Symbiodinium microadriaticum]
MIEKLDDDQKRDFYRKGYIVVKGAVPEDVVAAARTRIKAANRGENLAGDPAMTDLVNKSAITPILHDALGDFDPPTAAQVGVLKKREPGDHFNSLGYRDRDMPYFGAEVHIDGNITCTPPQEVQQGSADEIYKRYITSGPKGDIGRSASVMGDNFTPLFQDPEMTLALGSFTAFVFVCLSPQMMPGSGQTALLEGGHHAMQAFFRKQRAINDHLGPEGPDWPRLDYEVPNRCGMNYLPPEVRDQFVDDTSETTPDGRKWPRPTQILMEPGDACIAMYHIPHCGTRNEVGPESRKNIIFRIRNKKRQPDKVVQGVSDHPDRGFMGEFLDYEEGNDPWERSKDAMCNMWDEWEGMTHIVAEMEAADHGIALEPLTRIRPTRFDELPASGDLGFTGLVKLFRRVVPFMVPEWPHLFGIMGILVASGLFLLVAGFLNTDLMLNKVLLGNPLPADQAGWLGFDPAVYSDVEKLSDEARRTLRNFVIALGAAQIVLGFSLEQGLRYYVTWILQRINQRLRQAMLEHLEVMSLSYHNDAKVGDAVYRLFQDSAMVTQVMQNMLIYPVILLSIIISNVFVVIFFSPWLGLFTLAASVPVVLCFWYFGPRLRARSIHVRRATSDLASEIQEAFAGIRVIKAYGLEERQLGKFYQESTNSLQAAFELRRSIALMRMLVLFAGATIVIASQIFMTDQVLGNKETFGAGVVAFVAFAFWNLGAWSAVNDRLKTVTGNIYGYSHLFGAVQDMSTGLDRSLEVLDLEPDIVEIDDPHPMPPLGDGVRYRDVSFSYSGDEDTLTSINLNAPPGSITAIVGPTGAGKTTMTSMLLRLIDPKDGAVTIGDEDIRNLKLDELRGNIALAIQENLLFADTVRENIRYAAAGASDERVEEAARIACADDFIQDLPQGYDTFLGERGGKLSTGQRQRLTIARAVVKDAPILVLDEPTAALDVQTELQVMKNLAEWGRDRVIFIVSHRLSTIKNADQIIYLERGRMREVGSHDELMARPEGSRMTDRTFDDHLDTDTELTNRQALQMVGRALRYIGPIKHLYFLKVFTMTVSLIPYVFAPWPIKIIIDHAILGMPIVEDKLVYPPLIKDFVLSMQGMEPMQVLFTTLAVVGVVVFLFGFTQFVGGEDGPASQSANLVQGQDQATVAENQASSSWSLVSGLWGYLDIRVQMRLSQAVTHMARSHLLQRLARLPMSKLDDSRIGDAVYRAMYDAPSLPSLCFEVTITPLTQFLLFTSTFIMMAATYYEAAPEILYVSLLLVPVMFAVAFPFSGVYRRVSQNSRSSGSATTDTIEESMSNIGAVQGMGANDRERKRFQDDSTESFRQYRMVVLVRVIVDTSMYVAGTGLFLWAWYITSEKTIDGVLTPGDYGAVLGIYLTFNGVLSGFARIWYTLQDNVAGARRIFFFIDMETESDRGTKTLPTVREGVSLEGAAVTYPDGRQAIRSADLEARVGEVIAICGPTGAGKTSLAYLIPGFLRPSAGRVLIDGVDTADVDVTSLRDQVAYVFQENVLFAGTIAENIRNGNLEATDEEVERAARMAGAYDFIADLPDGFHSQVGRSGSKLSVGQKQRVCIARGLVRDARILILDEPTSALDPETEAQLVQTLREAAKGRLVIVIAHRLSTIRRADKIVFMQDGEIVETGILQMSDPYILFGSYASYYTAKTRSYLRKKGIPFIERLPSDPRFRDVARPASGSARIPQMMTPEGQVLQDTVTIQDELESRFSDRPAVPRGPRQRSFVHLMELLASDGLVMLAWMHRWIFEGNFHFVKMDFGRSFKPQGTDEELLHYGNLIADKMMSNGSLPEATDELKASLDEQFLGLLKVMEAHLIKHPYFLGGHPSAADYAIMGALHAHMGRDPVPLHFMQKNAPRVFRWVEHMIVPEVQSPEFADREIDYPSGDQVPTTALAVLHYIAELVGERFVLMALAYNQMVKDLAPKSGHVFDKDKDQPTLPPVEVEYRGQTHNTPISLYAIWVLQRAQEVFSSLDGNSRAVVEDMLGDGVALDLISVPLTVKLERVNNRLQVA